MPLPIAHFCLGASIASVLRRRTCEGMGLRGLVLAGALLAIVPDFDFVLVWVFRLGPGWHRGFSHSLAFSALVACCASVLFKAEWEKAFPVLWAAVASHSLIDALTSRIAPGVEFLWPVIEHRFSAGLVDYFDFTIRVRGPLEFLRFVVGISAVEAILFVPVFLVIRLITKRASIGSTRQASIEQQESAEL